jgi:hypothetical protein
MAVRTQGTELFFIDPYDNSVVKVGCPTNISGLDTTVDQIETTCLDSDAREYEAGMPTPGTATFTINADPQDESHIRLYELFKEGTKLEWAIGWKDGTDAPTVDSVGEFDLPTDRTWIVFNGFVNSFPFEFALNSVVASNVGVQLSGFPEWVPASP